MTKAVGLLFQAAFAFAAALAIQDNIALAAICALAVSVGSFFVARKTNSMFEMMLAFAVFNYLFFAHAALRTRDFDEVAIDAQVIVRLLCGVSILAVVATKVMAQGSLVRPRSGEGLLLLFGVYVIVAAPLSLVPTYSFASGVLWFSLVVGIIFSVRKLGAANTFGVIAYAMLSLLIVSASMSWVAPDAAEIVDFAGGQRVYRFKGAFLHPIQLGTGMSVLAVYCLYRLMEQRRSLIVRTLYLLLLVSAFWMMQEAQSRVSMLVTFMGGMYLLLARSRAIGIGLLLWSGAIAVTVVLGLGIGEVASRFTRSGDIRELLTFTNRTPVWDYSLNFVEKNPWFGYGFGSTRSLFSDAPSQFGWNVAHTHNLVIQGLIEVGISGLCLLFFVIIRIIPSIFTFRNTIVGIVSIQILLRGMTEVVLFFYIPGVMLAMLALAISILAQDQLSTRNIFPKLSWKTHELFQVH